jgi:hypothetical protein
MEWTSSVIQIWFFHPNNIPVNLADGATPDTSTWGTPMFTTAGSSQSIDENFSYHQVVFNTDFCGSYAGLDVFWQQTQCAASYSTCNAYVAANPSAFVDAFWTINSLKVYQKNTPATSGCSLVSGITTPIPSGSTCAQPGFSHDTVSTLMVAYTAGSPYVATAGACGAQCLATSGCTNVYFITGQSCNLHSGPSSFAESTAAGYYIYYDAQCFTCSTIATPTCTTVSGLATPTPTGSTCDQPGFSHDIVSQLLISYTSGPYVASAGACGAQCLATNTCTNVYFIQGSYCNLHFGVSSYAESTAAGYYSYYDAQCFTCTPISSSTSTGSCATPTVLAAPPASASTCGPPGFSHDTTSTLIVGYTAGSPYVESAAACGAQCLATSGCTNLYFIAGSNCNLHAGASSFAESTAAGFYSYYTASCFSSGAACGSFGFSHDVTSTLIVSYTAGSPYVASAATCGAQCLATSSCTNVYFIEGSYCNLHSGAASFAESTAAGYYSWYQTSCFQC